MANIADLIANRNQELEDFKQKKQEERTEAYERRDAAVMEVTSDPEKYRAFLDLHAQTMYNAVNTATVWKQRPGATQLLPRKKWTELGRKIREDETPVQVFMRDTRSGYIKLDYVYDKAQTVGDPVPVRGILRDGTPDMEKALGALLQSSPVEVVATADIFGEAEYQPEENRIAIQPDLSGAASFRALAREIVYAQIGTGMEAGDFDPRPYELDAHSVCYALCRRYGVPVKQPDFSGVAHQYGELEAPERLNMLRETCDLSKVLNRSIERALDLRQRSRAKNAVLTR